MTHVSAFGRDRAGTLPVLREMGAIAAGRPSRHRRSTCGGARVSSARIRELVAAGRLASAARLLGRPYALVGDVVHGERRGRELGFPTANLHFADPVCLPPGRHLRGPCLLGWRGLLLAPSEHAEAVISLGTQPTFGGRVRLFEVHLLDRDVDLYGQRLRVELCRRLREQQRYDSADDLIVQMGRDVERARAVLARGVARGRQLLAVRWPPYGSSHGTAVRPRRDPAWRPPNQRSIGVTSPRRSAKSPSCSASQATMSAAAPGRRHADLAGQARANALPRRSPPRAPRRRRGRAPRRGRWRAAWTACRTCPRWRRCRWPRSRRHRGARGPAGRPPRSMSAGPGSTVATVLLAASARASSALGLLEVIDRQGTQLDAQECCARSLSWSAWRRRPRPWASPASRISRAQSEVEELRLAEDVDEVRLRRHAGKRLHDRVRLLGGASSPRARRGLRGTCAGPASAAAPRRPRR